MEMVLGFLSVLLGLSSIMMVIVLTRNTNILVKSEDERAKKIIEEGNKRTQEILERMRKEHEETMAKMDSTLKFIGSLIYAEGEKTRELIKEMLKK